MISLNKRNFFSSLFVLAFFVFFYVCSLGLSDSAAYWPKLICVVGGVLSAANAAAAGVQWQKSRDNAALFPLNLSQLKRSALLLVVAAVWVFLVPIVGYLVTATLATLIVVLVFEPKRDKAHVIRDIVVTLIFSVVIYQLFALLGVHFPKGLLL